jgi:hypothetical protein
MTRIRSLNELEDVLSKDLAPRKQEMTTLKLRMLSAREHEKRSLLRAGFVMIYAHFEGFIRLAATAYVQYVSHQGLSFSLLKPNFVAVGLKSQLQALGAIEKATVVSATVHQFLNGMNDPALFLWTGEMDARHNLKSEVLMEIFALTGLDTTWYQTKWAFVDQVLIENRNNIAHGRLSQPEEPEYLQAHQQTIEFLERFRTDVQNAAATSLFRR